MSIYSNITKVGYALLSTIDAYGERTLPEEATGYIEMSIRPNSHAIVEGVPYTNSDYIGITTEPITDEYVIFYNNQRLKVQYVTPSYNEYYIVEIGKIDG